MAYFMYSVYHQLFVIFWPELIWILRTC